MTITRVGSPPPEVCPSREGARTYVTLFWAQTGKAKVKLNSRIIKGAIRLVRRNGQNTDVLLGCRMTTRSAVIRRRHCEAAQFAIRGRSGTQSSDSASISKSAVGARFVSCRRFWLVQSKGFSPGFLGGLPDQPILTINWPRGSIVRRRVPSEKRGAELEAARYSFRYSK